MPKKAPRVSVLTDNNIEYEEFYYAIRVAGKYTCRHLPWYKDQNHQTAEDKYYVASCDPNVASFVGLTHHMAK